ncbi:DUF2194 domain-containing protein [Pontibacillus sp. HMF3514]|uniref:DUF2194 domain-containing protein n=1 Tax=Pontibacillus sp. HMF3514 TaxID=2692425 RepID=UPI00131FEABB|nr:DUF2194 domain-containing protein [Pontibacillus sp. HMF3514]QHE53636.1 DUF2194 domain-containing protein [Pontibacillus sp. HMF3514]
MEQKFEFGKTIYVIIILVITFGIFLEVVRSDYILTLREYSNDSFRKESIDTNDSPVIPTDGKGEEETYLIVYDKEDTSSKDLKTNIVSTLTNIRKPNDSIPFSQIQSDLDSYSSIILTSENLDKFPNIQDLASYVENGGAVLFAVRPIPGDALYSLYRKMGVYEIGPLIQTKGIRMESNLLLKRKGVVIDDSFLTNSSLAVRLDEKVSLHATSIEGYPLLWERRYGEGMFVMFNGTMLHEKINRGLLTGAIGALQKDFIYPVHNFKLTYIHSFPAPLPKGSKSLDQEFYRDTWWPYVKDTSNQYHLSLTSGFLMSFDEEKEEGTKIPEYVKRDFVKYGRELLNQGGELALAGYNTQPLTPETDLRDVSQSVISFMKETMPTYSLTSFMPYNGKLNDHITQEFTDFFSDIDTIIPSYLEDDFGVENGVVYVPWVTNGYQYSDVVKWKMANSLTASGIFSHLITPWDEELINWRKASKDYKQMLQDISKQFPWLKSVTASEAGHLLKEWEQTDVKIFRDDQGIQIYQSMPYASSYILRTKKLVSNKQGCTVAKIDQDVYLIQTEKRICEVEVKE